MSHLLEEVDIQVCSAAAEPGVPFRVELSKPVSLLRQRVAEKFNLPIGRIRLRYAKQELKDQEALGFYGLSNASTIHLVLRPE